MKFKNVISRAIAFSLSLTLTVTSMPAITGYAAASNADPGYESEVVDHDWTNEPGYLDQDTEEEENVYIYDDASEPGYEDTADEPDYYSGPGYVMEISEDTVSDTNDLTGEESLAEDDLYYFPENEPKNWDDANSEDYEYDIERLYANDCSEEEIRAWVQDNYPEENLEELLYEEELEDDEEDDINEYDNSKDYHWETTGVGSPMALKKTVSETLDSWDSYGNRPKELPSGEYYLEDDLIMSEIFSVSEGNDITLDLNGHTLMTRRGLLTGGLIIKVWYGGTLRIIDSKGGGSISGRSGLNLRSAIVNEGKLYIESGVKIVDCHKNNIGGAGGAAIYNSNLLYFDGTIENCHCSTETFDGKGSAIYNEWFIDFYGEIIDCNGSKKTYGEAIYNDKKGNIRFHGDISGCHSGRSGGAIYNRGVLEMDAGLITGNSASRNGGAIYNEGTCTITSTCITGNEADECGGGIYNEGTLTLGNTRSGDSSFTPYISYNTAKKDGGAIYNTGTLEDIRGNIYKNNAGGSGGGIYSKSQFTMTGGAIYDNTADTEGDDILAAKGSQLHLPDYASMEMDKVEPNPCFSTSPNWYFDEKNYRYKNTTLHDRFPIDELNDTKLSYDMPIVSGYYDNYHDFDFDNPEYSLGDQWEQSADRPYSFLRRYMEIRCKNCGQSWKIEAIPDDMTVKDATCTEDITETFTYTFYFQADDGSTREFTSSVEEDIEGTALGHVLNNEKDEDGTYKYIVFNWQLKDGEDMPICLATYTCTVCHETVTADCTVSEDKDSPRMTSEGDMAVFYDAAISTISRDGEVVSATDIYAVKTEKQEPESGGEETEPVPKPESGEKVWQLESSGEAYSTFEEAMSDSAADGDTITLLADATENIALTDCKIILDLNGNVLSGNGAASVITVNAGSELTLTDSGSSGRITGGNAGVFVYGGAAFTMNGGTISGNTSSYGAGICNVGTFTMNGGTIKENTASGTGGGVYNNGTFTMTGGTITENTAASGGAGVYASGRSVFNLEGTPVISDNSGPDNTNSNVYLASSSHIILTGEAEDGARVGVNMATELTDRDTLQVTASEDGTEYYKSSAMYFFYDADDSCMGMANQNGKYVEFGRYVASLTKEGTVQNYFSVQEAVNAAGNTKGTVTMMGDSEENVKVAEGQDITLDLAGFILDGGGQDSVIKNSGTLTLTDSSGDDSGCVTGGKSTYGGGVYNAGRFVMNGGTVKGNAATPQGGGIYNLATFIMEGGTITDNTASTFGGGVYSDRNHEKGEFIMAGGEIKRNYAIQGGGIYTDYTFTMQGGKIYDNKADSSASDICSAADFATILKATDMMGNSDPDRCYSWRDDRSYTGYRYCLKLSYEDHLYSEEHVTFTWNGSDSCTAIFTCSDCGHEESVDCDITIETVMTTRMITATAAITNRDGSTLTVTNRQEEDLPVPGGEETEPVPEPEGGEKVWLLESNEETYSTFAKALADAADYDTITLLADTTENITITDGRVFLDLNGNILSGDGTTSVITVNAGTELTLMDNRGSGCITGGNPGVYVYGGADFIMNNGTISGNTSSYGAGICNVGTFTMNGGTIRENTASGTGGGVYNNGTFTMTGGTITKNTAASGGAGVYVSDRSVFNLEWSPVIADNYGPDNTNSNVYLASSSHIVLTRELVDGARVGVSILTKLADKVTLQITAAEDSTDYYRLSAEYFFYDGDDSYKGIADKNGKYVKFTVYVASLTTDDGENYTYYGSVQDAVKAAGKSKGTVTMNSDSAENIEVANGQNITLDLAGHTLDGKQKDSVIKNSGTLTLTDSSGDNSGRVTGGKVKYGGGVNNSGTFTMEGGTISGNTADSGGGVYNSGTFTMNEGSINENNTRVYDGGGVDSSGRFIMNGGTICGNNSSRYGGGVFCDGRFTMTGGGIIENSSNNDGGGVRVWYSGIFGMQGGEIKGNTSNGGGGGVSVAANGKNASFGMSGGTISENHAAEGGGVHVIAGGYFIPRSGKICDNTASLRGSDISAGADGSSILIVPASHMMGNSDPDHCYNWYEDGADDSKVRYSYPDQITDKFTDPAFLTAYYGATTVKNYIALKLAGDEGHLYSEENVTFTWNSSDGCTATFTCSDCGHEETVECDITIGTATATCTEAGSGTLIATATVTNRDGSTLSVTNEREGEVPALDHDWDDGVVTTESTCTESGVMTYTCKRCGATKTEDIPAFGHEWETGQTVVEDSEERHEERVSMKCTRCGLEYDEEIVVSTESGSGVTVHSGLTWSDVISADELAELFEADAELDFKLTAEKYADIEVPSADKTLAEETILSRWPDMDFAISYLDMSIRMDTLHADGSKDTREFTGTLSPVTLNVTVPEELLNADGDSYAVIRICDGEATLLDTTDNDDGTITFESDMFSAFAIVKLAEPQTPETGEEGEGTSEEGGTSEGESTSEEGGASEGESTPEEGGTSEGEGTPEGGGRSEEGGASEGESTSEEGGTSEGESTSEESTSSDKRRTSRDDDVSEEDSSSFSSAFVTGTWTRDEYGYWRFTSGEGRQYANEWGYLYNPYADTESGQPDVSWFHFGSDEIMDRRWYTDEDGGIYYFDPYVDNTQGRMYTGWNWIVGEDGVSRCYYFDDTFGTRHYGRLFISTTTPDGYTVDETGAWTENGAQVTR